MAGKQPPRRATLLQATSGGVADAARRLSGGLVAFPTETVYGLGANALNGALCREIFAVRSGRSRTPHRPLRDGRDAAALVVLDADERDRAGDGSSGKDRERSGGSSAGLESRAFHALAAPLAGGLTLVATRPHLPACLSAARARSAYASRRTKARRLIRSSGVPVAAPSANRFGVSPTTAQHVLEDLATRPSPCSTGTAAAVVVVLALAWHW